MHGLKPGLIGMGSFLPLNGNFSTVHSTPNWIDELPMKFLESELTTYKMLGAKLPNLCMKLVCGADQTYQMSFPEEEVWPCLTQPISMVKNKFLLRLFYFLLTHPEEEICSVLTKLISLQESLWTAIPPLLLHLLQTLHCVALFSSHAGFSFPFLRMSVLITLPPELPGDTPHITSQNRRFL